MVRVLGRQDCPYQFGACPEFTGATDYAEDAASFELPVQPGDILVAGTDGLWDNVPEADVLPLLPDAEEGALQVHARIQWVHCICPIHIYIYCRCPYI